MSREDRISPEERTSAEETLARWMEDEARARAAMGEPSTASVADIAQRSGLDFMQAVLSGELAQAPIAHTLDFLLVHVEPGRVIFQGTPKFRHYNPIGSVHGGWYCTLLDSAVACAVQTLVPRGKGYTTLEIKVNMVRRLTETTGPVRAEGVAVHVGASTGIAEGRLYDVQGKLYAHATSTCMIFPLQGPAR